MATLMDLTGRRFGYLLVVKVARTRSGPHRNWVCYCACGRETEVSGFCLRTGRTRSCGCLSKTMQRLAVTKHGMCRAREYNSWSEMRRRCNTKDHHKYHLYGGRGITICPEWDDFSVFYEDMGPRPPGTSLDRIDVNGNYDPGNCRWATNSEQVRNRRSFKKSKPKADRVMALLARGTKSITQIAVSAECSETYVRQLIRELNDYRLVKAAGLSPL